MKLIELYPPRMSLYGNKVTLLSTIPIVKGAPFQPKVVLSLEIAPIKQGTAIIGFAEYQVTTPYTYNVMIGSYLCLANTPTEVSNAIPINAAQTTNFNKTIHHFRDTRIGWWVGWQDIEKLYLNLVLYSAASSAVSGNKLTIDSNVALIGALVFCP